MTLSEAAEPFRLPPPPKLLPVLTATLLAMIALGRARKQ